METKSITLKNVNEFKICSQYECQFLENEREVKILNTIFEWINSEFDYGPNFNFLTFITRSHNFNLRIFNYEGDNESFLDDIMFVINYDKTILEIILMCGRSLYLSARNLSEELSITYNLLVFFDILKKHSERSLL